MYNLRSGHNYTKLVHLKISNTTVQWTPSTGPYSVYTEPCTLDALRTPALSEMFTLNSESFLEMRTETVTNKRKGEMYYLNWNFFEAPNCLFVKFQPTLPCIMCSTCKDDC